MQNLIIAIVSTIILSIIPNYINGAVSWIWGEWCNMAIICIWILTAFLCISNKKINERCLIASVFYFQLTELLFYPYCFFNPEVETFIWPVFMVFMVMSFHKVSSRNYEYASDKILDDNVYLCFWKPKRSKSVFTSLIGAPFGSMNIYVKDSFWGFSWKTGRYHKRFIKNYNVEKQFLIIDTGIPSSKRIIDSLEKLIDEPARIPRLMWIRCRCILILKPLLKELGREFEPNLFEFIPAIYALKLLRWRNEKSI